MLKNRSCKLFFPLIMILFAPALCTHAKGIIVIDQLNELNRLATQGLLRLFGVKPEKAATQENITVDKVEVKKIGGKPTKQVEETKTPEKKRDLPHEKILFKDIAGLDNVLTEVKEVVDFVKSADKFKALGARVPCGILLEGPPGTGKTLIAKAIANEADCNFLYASGSSFVEMFVGVGAQRVRDLFAQAHKQKPAIIFIDEFDAIGAVSRGAGANEEYRQTMNELLCQLDGFNSDNSIIVIAATNYAKALDPALTRAGRFDRILKITLPNITARKEILNLYINKLPAQEVTEKYIDEVALKTDGLNCADLKNLVNEAALAAVRDHKQTVQDKHLIIGAEKVLKQRRR